jgi:hypothetical protein
VHRPTGDDMINYRELVGRAWSLQAGLPDPMSILVGA